MARSRDRNLTPLTTPWLSRKRVRDGPQIDVLIWKMITKEYTHCSLNEMVPGIFNYS